MTVIGDNQVVTGAFRSLHTALQELLAAERLVVAAPCSRHTIEQWLQTAALLAPNTPLTLLLATDRPLWQGRAADLIAALPREVVPPARRFSPTRGALRLLRRLRPEAFLVLADEERGAQRWAQLLGILSGASRVYLLSIFDRSLRTVRPGDLLISAGRRLRTEAWLTLSDLPMVGRALYSLDRATLQRCLRSAALPSPATDQRQLRVLLIRSTPGASTRYRMENKCEHLRLLGFSYTFRAARDYVRDPNQAARDARDHDLAIVHRFPCPGPADLALDALSRLRRPIVYDIADLLFDPGSVAHVPPAAQRAVVRQIALLSLATHVIASTDYLAAQLADSVRPAFVIGNFLSGDLLEASGIARARRTPHDGVRLGYLSGSATHDRDLAVIGPALADVLQRHTEATLTLVGPVAVPPELTRFRDRLTRLEPVPWQDLPALTADLDISLAPLEIDSPFCRGKSELRYVEAGAVGVPTVASPTPAFQRAIRHGETGFLATSTQDWVAALDALITRPGLRKDIGEAARREVAARYTPQEGAQQLGEALRQIVGATLPKS